jgi:hypothetical protein
MSYRRDFTKPFHCELIANKKAFELRKLGEEWEGMSQNKHVV